MSAYFLKGVVPEWNSETSTRACCVHGLQLVVLVLIIAFPQIALWMPQYLYGMKYGDRVSEKAVDAREGVGGGAQSRRSDAGYHRTRWRGGRP